jgi:hypothetical protein
MKELTNRRTNMKQTYYTIIKTERERDCGHPSDQLVSNLTGAMIPIFTDKKKASLKVSMLNRYATNPHTLYKVAELTIV